MARRIPTHPRIEHRVSDTEAIVLDSTEASPELTRQFDVAGKAAVKRIQAMLRERGFRVAEDRPEDLS